MTETEGKLVEIFVAFLTLHTNLVGARSGSMPLKKPPVGVRMLLTMVDMPPANALPPLVLLALLRPDIGVDVDSCVWI